MKKILFILFSSLVFYGAVAQNKSAGSPVLYDTIFTQPTVLASFPGGDSAWKVYVKKHVKYPRKAWWQEVETDVSVRIVVNKDGTIESAQHLNTTTYGFENEAVRLVLKSGKWIPAMYNGRPVKSEGVLKIEFRLK